jgi:hypothetical protein
VLRHESLISDSRVAARAEHSIGSPPPLCTRRCCVRLSFSLVVRLPWSPVVRLPLSLVESRMAVWQYSHSKQCPPEGVSTGLVSLWLNRVRVVVCILKRFSLSSVHAPASLWREVPKVAVLSKRTKGHCCARHPASLHAARVRPHSNQLRVNAGSSVAENVSTHLGQARAQLPVPDRVRLSGTYRGSDQ